jgi:hypothetical protein
LLRTMHIVSRHLCLLQATVSKLVGGSGRPYMGVCCLRPTCAPPHKRLHLLEPYPTRSICMAAIQQAACLGSVRASARRAVASCWSRGGGGGTATFAALQSARPRAVAWCGLLWHKRSCIVALTEFVQCLLGGVGVQHYSWYSGSVLQTVRWVSAAHVCGQTMGCKDTKVWMVRPVTQACTSNSMCFAV